MLANFYILLKNIFFNLDRNFTCARKSYIRGSFSKSKHIKLNIGENCRIYNLNISGSGKVVIANNVEIRDLYIHVGNSAEVIINDSVFIGMGVKFLIYKKLTINKHTLISPDVLIVDNDHVRHASVKFKDSGLISLPILIGENCWIGAKSTICKGVDICSGTIVGAMSLVNQNIAEPSLYAGIPATLKKSFNNE